MRSYRHPDDIWMPYDAACRMLDVQARQNRRKVEQRNLRLAIAACLACLVLGLIVGAGS
jgi:hypothetical protein